MKEFTQWMKIFQVLDENKKRWFAAEKATEIGRGGIKLISELTRMSRTTLINGIAELTENKNLPTEGVITYLPLFCIPLCILFNHFSNALNE